MLGKQLGEPRDAVRLAHNTNHNGNGPTKDPSTICQLRGMTMILVYPRFHKLQPCTQAGQADINSNCTGHLVPRMLKRYAQAEGVLAVDSE